MALFTTCMMAVCLVVDKSIFANLKILAFSVLYDIIHISGLEDERKSI